MGAAVCAVIELQYPKRGNSRPAIGRERMLRIHFVQHWFNLADFACEELLYDRASLRRFVGVDLGCEAVPDATTPLGFGRLRTPIGGERRANCPPDKPARAEKQRLKPGLMTWRSQIADTSPKWLVQLSLSVKEGLQNPLLKHYLSHQAQPRTSDLCW
ncbi:hypothetical protein HDG37_003053 [Paraburkholderia sp. MM5384-R2]|nr:hypothetical protein [Paraburkholderia sp. MM5384-R2]